MANSWWVIIPQGDQSQSDSYKQQVDFRAQFQPGSAEYNALKANKPISYDGMNWVYWKGPYATEAEAKAAQNPKPSPNAAQAAGRAVSGGVGGLLNSTLKFGNTHGLLGRVLKVGLGSVMIILGVSKLTHADNKIMDLAKNIKVLPI
jgi:hypothetical protein